jgi:signal transduction histidine kinase/DNA-binding response OmpR family regulator
MEENRPQLRRSARNFILLIYLFFLFLAVISFFVLSDLEQDGIVRDTQLERGIVTFFFLLVWTLVCFRLYRINTRIFDLRSQTFDAREAEHYAIKEAARLREQFMANMSHEIRTPLNAIIGFSNLLLRGELAQRENELASNIQLSSENLLSIVNDILDFSKIEAGMLVLENIPFDLKGLFHSVQQMFYEKARQKNLALDVYLAPGLPEQLVGDPTRLTQVLVNLLGNALKFTQRGGVVVSVVPVEPISKDRLTVRIEVRDSGIGIPSNQLERVFERFTQSDEQTTRIYGGNGLGLSIVKQLVEAMHGSISVQSEKGNGSVFTVLIPFDRKIAQANTTGQDDDKSNSNLPIYPLPSVRLLVAEDNPMNRRVVELLFEEWKFQFVMAHNGREAVEILAKNPNAFDLVLMDIQMPELDGYAATHQIRQKLGLNIPIVAMTAHALAGEREKCLQLGMNDYLAKPIREQELRSMITRFAPETNEGAKPEIDRNYLHETTLGNVDYQRELANIFLLQAPKDLDAIQAALRNSDLAAAATAAHSMKSTVGYMGFAQNIGLQLATFEYACKNGASVSELVAELQRIQEIVERAKGVVKKMYGV